MNDTQFAAFRLYGLVGLALMLTGGALFGSYILSLLRGMPGVLEIGETGSYFVATGAAMVFAVGYLLRTVRHNLSAAQAVAVPIGTGFALWALARLLAAAYSPEVAATVGPLLYVETLLFATMAAVMMLSARNEKGVFRTQFMNLNKGVLATYSYVYAWVSVLMLSNMVAPAALLVWEAVSPGATGITGVAAPFMLTVFWLGPIIGAVLYPVTGMSRLMGLIHAPWYLAAWVLYQQAHVNGVWQTPETIFDYWVYAALTTAILSLIIDTLDVVRYTFGDRKKLWDVPSAG